MNCSVGRCDARALVVPKVEFWQAVRSETAETRTTFLKPLPDEVRHALPLGLSPFLPCRCGLAGAEGASGRFPVPIASPQLVNQQSCIIRFVFYFCVFFFITLYHQR